MLGRSLTKTFDFKDVDAALKRAAWKAVHGAREDKAGRFSAEPKTLAVKEGAAAPFEAEKKRKN